MQTNDIDVIQEAEPRKGKKKKLHCHVAYATYTPLF